MHTTIKSRADQSFIRSSCNWIKMSRKGTRNRRGRIDTAFCVKFSEEGILRQQWPSGPPDLPKDHFVPSSVTFPPSASRHFRLPNPSVLTLIRILSSAPAMYDMLNHSVFRHREFVAFLRLRRDFTTPTRTFPICSPFSAYEQHSHDDITLSPLLVLPSLRPPPPPQSS